MRGRNSGLRHGFSLSTTTTLTISLHGSACPRTKGAVLDMRYVALWQEDHSKLNDGKVKDRQLVLLA